MVDGSNERRDGTELVDRFLHLPYAPCLAVHSNGRHQSEYTAVRPLCSAIQRSWVSTPRMRRPPFPWRLEVATPDATLRLPCLILVGNIVEGVLAERDGPALLNQSATEVLISDAANGDDPPVAIGILFRASDRPLADLVRESESGLLTAPEGLVVNGA